MTRNQKIVTLVSLLPIAYLVYLFVILSLNVDTCTDAGFDQIGMEFFNDLVCMKTIRVPLSEVIGSGR